MMRTTIGLCPSLGFSTGLVAGEMPDKSRRDAGTPYDLRSTPDRQVGCDLK
jgi:hypothetical protein